MKGYPFGSIELGIGRHDGKGNNPISRVGGNVELPAELGEHFSLAQAAQLDWNGDIILHAVLICLAKQTRSIQISIPKGTGLDPVGLFFFGRGAFGNKTARSTFAIQLAPEDLTSLGSLGVILGRPRYKESSVDENVVVIQPISRCLGESFRIVDLIECCKVNRWRGV